MPTEFETLRELGFDQLEDIEKYTSRIEGDQDVLKIYLRRKPGAWMSSSKKFKFKRIYKQKADDGFVPFRTTTEANPVYLSAVAELDRLVSEERCEDDIKQQLLTDLEHLEKVVNNKIAEIRSRLDNL